MLGPYELIAPLGRGGMGEVFRARDTRLGRDVAIKFLSAALAGDPQALARFEREGRAVAALSHPNIVALYDVGREGDTAYVVTELLEGVTHAVRQQVGSYERDMQERRDSIRGKLGSTWSSNTARWWDAALPQIDDWTLDYMRASRTILCLPDDETVRPQHLWAANSPYVDSERHPERPLIRTIVPRRTSSPRSRSSRP